MGCDISLRKVSHQPICQYVIQWKFFNLGYSKILRITSDTSFLIKNNRFHELISLFRSVVSFIAILHKLVVSKTKFKDNFKEQRIFEICLNFLKELCHTFLTYFQWDIFTISFKSVKHFNVAFNYVTEGIRISFWGYLLQYPCYIQNMTEDK